MLLSMVTQFNWVDVLVVIILLRIGYIAIKRGFPVELFKLLGTILSIYLALHYFTWLSDWLRSRLGLKNIPLEFLDFLCFFILAVSGYGIFILLREVFSRFIKVETTPRLNKTGGFILGVVRGFLLVSLVTFMLLVSSISYLKKSTINSYSGKHLFKISYAVYSGLWNNFFAKFATKEQFNQTVLEIQESLTKK